MIPLPLIAFAGRWWKAALGALVIFPAAFLLGQCSGDKAATTRIKGEQARAIIAAQTRNAKAREKASEQRLTDTEASRITERDLSHADDALPDSRPSDVRRALLCERLRQQAARGGPAVPGGC
jgi:hypothetical protein